MDIMSIPLFISGLGFISICFLLYGLYHYYQAVTVKKKMLYKIQQYKPEYNEFSDTLSPSEEQGLEKTGFNRFLGIVGKLVLHSEPHESEGIMRTRFWQAGISNPYAIHMFWGVKIVLAFAMAVIFVVAVFLLDATLTPTKTLGIALALALVGLYLPDLWLNIKTGHRKERLARSFPDALDLMVVCVEAGVGLDSAFNRVAEEFSLASPDISKEFKYVTLELRAGKSRKVSLENLARRTGLEEIKSFAGLMIQTMQFGTSISRALRVHAEAFRTKRRQKAEEMAAKLPVKMLIPIALCIFPALFIVILGPAVIRIFDVLLPSLGG